MSQEKAEKLTRRQAAIIGLYTGVQCGPFSDIQAYAEELAHRSIFTHEFANIELVKLLGELSKPDFLAICAESDVEEG